MAEMTGDMEFTADRLLAHMQESDMLSPVPSSTMLAEGRDAQSLRYGFHIGKLAFLIPEAVITEVMDNPAVFPLPRAPRWFAGMINMRGNVVPLFNLLALPGVPAAPAPDRVLVLGQGSAAVAIYIDGLPEPLHVKDDRLEPDVLPDVLQPFTRFAFSDRDNHWYEFSYETFFQHLSTGGLSDDGAIE